MKLTQRCSVALLASLAVTCIAQAGEDDPHIGYVYPAGGQQGTTFQVLLGGQNLDGPVIARVSGDGVTTEVVEHIRPLNQGQFKEMQNRMGELQKKKEAAGVGGSRRRGRASENREPTGEWTAEDEATLAEIRARLATFSIRRSSVPALVETVTLQVTVSAEAPLGRRELRLQTEQGLTNPLVFCVGQLPEVAEPSGRSIAVAESQKRGGRGRKRQQSTRPDPGTSPLSTEPEVETDIVLPATLNGQILPGDVDRYRFEARQGQHLVVDVSARKLIPYLSDAVPGWFQATVALLDADGSEIAFDDDFLFHPDPVLHSEIPQDGTYSIEIRDALYRGREDFVYRIAVGELPFITDVFPLGCQAGEETVFSLNGWNLPQTELRRTADEVVPYDGLPSPSKWATDKDVRHTAGRFPGAACLKRTFADAGIHFIGMDDGGLASNLVPISTNDLPEHVESEPNNNPTSAQPITLPAIINGRINRPGDVDVYCIECSAADEIVAEVHARRLGSALDSVLKLTDASGRQLALNDDFEDKAAGLTTHHADSRLSATIPAAGLYYLYLGDSQQQGGDAHCYRLRIGASQPDFELRVVPSSVNARAGTTVPITVHAMRKDGFDGEIILSLQDSPAGFTLSGGRIPTGQDLVRATLTVPAEAMEPTSISVVGHAVIGSRTVTHLAVAADDMMQAFIYRHLVPAESLQVAVTGRPRRSSGMHVLTSEPVRIPIDGTSKVPIDIPTRSFFGAIQLELSNPPEGLSIESVSLDSEGSTIVLQSDAGKIASGLAGNLIINVFAAKTGEDSGKGKEQRKKRRILLSALPAIPFEIVGE